MTMNEAMASRYTEGGPHDGEPDSFEDAVKTSVAQHTALQEVARAAIAHNKAYDEYVVVVTDSETSTLERDAVFVIWDAARKALDAALARAREVGAVEEDGKHVD